MSARHRPAAQVYGSPVSTPLEWLVAACACTAAVIVIELLTR